MRYPSRQYGEIFFLLCRALQIAIMARSGACDAESLSAHKNHLKAVGLKFDDLDRTL